MNENKLNEKWSKYEIKMAEYEGKLAAAKERISAIIEENKDMKLEISYLEKEIEKYKNN